MNILKINFLALFIACFSFAQAGSSTGAGNNYQFAAVECTTESPNHIHISCKVNEVSTGHKVELTSDLINYDVKDKDGDLISSGHGTTAFVEEAKLGSEEDYTINVYALINGEIISQTVNMKTPAIK